MSDVARRAGVSLQTVSRVLHAHPHIRPATRERVERAIAELGYRPNGAARALARGRSGVIGVVSTSAALPGPRGTERALDDAARAAGYAVASIELPQVTRDRLTSALEELQLLGVEGVVVVSGHDAVPAVTCGTSSRCPLVVVDGRPGPGTGSVGVDEVAGAAQAVRHLAVLGHRRVVHVSGPADWLQGRRRAEGWRSTATELGLIPTTPLRGDWSAASGHAAGLAVADDPDVTAVFAANDSMAIGVVHALHQRGLEVPGDVSVVGFDDVAEAPYLSPPLTTVRQDRRALGTTAFDLLSARLRGDPPRTPAPVLPELAVRSSTAPARSRLASPSPRR